MPVTFTAAYPPARTDSTTPARWTTTEASANAGRNAAASARHGPLLPCRDGNRGGDGIGGAAAVAAREGCEQGAEHQANAIDALHPPEERGLVDVFRAHHAEGGLYSWWDYRGVAFFKDQGLRIDHIYATAPLAARSVDCVIDRAARKGQDASDHAPVVATFRD